MITLVIYGLIAVALAASAGYAFIVFSSSGRQLTQLEENQVRIGKAAASLRASLLAVDSNGTLFAPMGSTSTNVSYTTLPTVLGVVSTTPWGQPYEYCPVSPTGISNALSGNSATVNGSTTSYAVKTYSPVTTAVTPATQSLSYVITSPTQVIASGSSQAGYVAFIVSTLGPGQAMPDCSAIAVGANGLTVPGGTVTGITSGFSFMQRVVASTGRMEIYVNPNATGNGTGVDAVDAMTSLDTALGLWQALQPHLTDIYLEPNANYTYTSSNTLNAAAIRYAALGEDTSLVIQTDPAQLGTNGNGYSSNKATVIFSSPLVLNSATTFQNLNVQIANPTANSPIITTHAPFIFKYGQLATSDGSVGLFDAYNTNLTLTDVNMADFNLNVVNSTVELLSEQAPINYLNSLMASSSIISVNGPSSSLYSWTIGGTVPGWSEALVLGNSDLTIGSSQANIVVNTSSPVYLSNSALTINSAGTVNGVLGSELAVPSTYAYDGSSVAVQGTLSESGTASYGTTLSGSSLAVNGSLQTISSLGAIGATESTLTGSGAIHISGATVACVTIVESNGTLYPIRLSKPTINNYGYPLFGDVKTGGVPPLFAYDSANNNNAYLSSADTTTVNQLNGTVTSPYAMTDPFIKISGLTPPQSANNYPLDPTTFEAAVRNIMNNEFVKGLNINFTGSCLTP